MSACRLACLALLILAPLAGPAAAETLIAVTSPSVVRIEPDFNGAEITVFGTVERDGVAISRSSPYEIAVVVEGPEQTVVARRKDRLAGVWVNAADRTFVNVPGYYSVLTTAPLDDIGTPGALRQHRIGIGNLLITDARGVKALAGADPFRESVVRHMRETQRYDEHIGDVTFLSPSLFRSVVALPAGAPVGTYKVTVVLLQGSVPLAHTEAFLQVTKAGFEQWMYLMALRQPLVYGIGTVITGLLAGWLAAVLFRRD